MPRNKTEIRKFMVQHDISVYALLQEMGLDPEKNHSSWSRRLNGTGLVSEPQLVKLVKALETLSGKVFIVKYTPIKFKLS